MSLVQHAEGNGEQGSGAQTDQTETEWRLRGINLMSGRRQRKAPGEQGSLNRGLSVPGESRGSWGERRQYYKPRGNLFQSTKRGAGGRTSAPLLSFPKCPHTRKEKIGNSDDKITAGLGRNRIGGGGVEWCRVGRPENPSLYPGRRPSFCNQRTDESKRPLGSLAEWPLRRTAG